MLLLMYGHNGNRNRGRPWLRTMTLSPMIQPYDSHPKYYNSQYAPLYNTSVAHLHQGAGSVLRRPLAPRAVPEDLSQNKSDSPRLFQLPEWHDMMLCDELLTSYIQYTNKRKVTINKKAHK